ncbi:MAG: hypothetical protein A2268_15145 [Candidatus Raymondbacteria bacterium RifOxyA12_full_50_37]|nr:MAG: hypothetical protein A2268_15145 [Candidatus Raymondbacteria bacterium RifOxyA12_full_50_37]OGJ88507.1 MAG: hypothetical protein A2248_20115 [Candidatus Raymondbacteria bacterium RIFOXYA2_FULL_49_16]OGJ90610.1 MAG: hypothetical protein A2350_18395 [Candidatus Raymondbacteria bacterium RifOxyB12_full_50_8]OGJ98968.1 MAG: hypothetical protein A2453_10835 [Candidatus Raymondbacteria bacterium RIFOXYC2_FULL_50_21]OGK00606.1 MAG: hypothetical protein A2487_13680 [Candidatus Raymondbacteria b
MNVHIFIQARFSSTRLPGKVLLPVDRLPVVALCARRAANTGLDVTVLTSTDKTDDVVEAVLSRYDIPCFRGPLNNVFKRFLLASAQFPDADIIVRLTADNLLPDGSFIQELVDQLRKERLNYLGTSSPEDSLPYGLSAEAFTMASLRSMEKYANDPAVLEHVTPKLRADNSGKLFKPQVLRQKNAPLTRGGRRGSISAI